MSRCPICSKPVPQKDNGRPKVYCSERCKGKAKRRNAQIRDRASVDTARNTPAEDARFTSPGAPLCHVCGLRAATVGVPGPLLCTSCAVPPVSGTS